MFYSHIRYTAALSIVILGMHIVAPIVENTYANNATYYVDASAGNDTNDGLSEGTAWQTISRVNSGGFLPGDQILFKCGEGWNEQLIIQDSGASGNPITFGQYGAVCNGTNKPAMNYTGAPQITESGSVSYVNIQDFDLTAGDSPTGVVEFSGNGTDIQISNTSIGNPNGTCMSFFQSNNLIVSGNTFSNCMYGVAMGNMSGSIVSNTFSSMGTGSAITMSETSSGSRTISSNDFSNLDGTAILFGENSMILQNTFTSICQTGTQCAAIENVSLVTPRDLNSTIQENFITNVGTGTASSIYQLDAIHLGAFSAGVTITGNTFSNSQNGITIADSSNNTVTSNTIYNPRNYAITIREFTAASATGNTISNNTLLTYNPDYAMVRVENTINASDVLASFSNNTFLNTYKPKLPIIEVLNHNGNSSQLNKTELTQLDVGATNFTYFGYKTYTSTGSYSGGNLLTNGNFTTDITGWSTDVLTLSHDNTGDTMHAAQGIDNSGTISSNVFSITNGAIYEISGTLKNITNSEGHDVKIRLTNSVDTLYADREFDIVATGTGTTFTSYVTANTTAADAELHFILTNANSTLELDNLVVRKVVGLVNNNRTNEAVIAKNPSNSVASISCASLGIPAPFCGQYVNTNNSAATFSLSLNPQTSRIIFWNNATNILNRPSGSLVPSSGSIPNGDPVTLTWSATNSLSQRLSGLTYTGSFDYSVAASGSMVLTPPNDGTTTYYFNATNDIGTSTYTADVVTSNTPPVVNPAYATGAEDTLSITGIVTATDSNSGGSISYTLFDSPLNGVILNFDASGSFDYRPNPDFCGNDTFTFRAWDGFGLGNDTIGNPGVVTVTVTCSNDAPVAIDDTLSGTGGVTELLDVLTNDTDVDSPYVPQTFAITSVTQPSNGVVSISGTMVEFTPNALFYGGDSFTYTMEDQSGTVSNVATVNLTIAPGNNIPPVVSGNSYAFNEDTPYVGVLSGSDINGDTLTFTATTLPTNGTLVIVGSGFTYTPNTNYHGSDSFVFEANDGTYNSTGATINLTINSIEDLPIATNDTINIQMDTPTTIDALINDSDGDNLSPIPPNQGLTITGFTQPSNGSVSVVGTGFLYTPNSLYLGPDSFDYSIIDSNGNISNTGTVNITVSTTNQPPVADSGAYSTAEDTLLVGTLSGSDPDLTPVTFVLDTSVATGSLNLSSTGEFTYTPSTNFNGTVSFTFHVSDGVFSSSGQTVTIDVTPVNDIPVAAGDNENANEDTPTTFFPLVNDSDPDIGDSIHISTIISQPSQGSAVLSGTTEIVYTPNADFCGTDALVYQDMDLSGAVSGGGTININVGCINDAPTVNDSSYSVLGNIPTSSGNSISATLTGVDIDGDTLTYTVLSVASNGTLSVSLTGAMSYSPNLGFSGTDSFTYYVDDGSVSSSGATVTITVNPNGMNLTPTAYTGSYSINEDTTLIGVATGNDPEGATLIFSASTLPIHGTLTLQSSGSFTYTPVANYYGPDSFNFTVNDGVFTSVAASISLTVNSVNDTPVANNDTINGTEDTTSVISPITNDTDADVGDSFVINSFTQGSNGVVTQSGTFLNYVPNTNYCGTDNIAYSLIDQSGAVSNTGTINISLACVNDAPVGANDTTATGTEDTAIIIPVLANDTDIEDGIPVSLANITQPTIGGSIGIVGSNIVFSPTTNYCGSSPITFTYQARDSSSSLSNSATVTIPAITCVNDVPVTQTASYTMTGNIIISSGALDGSGILIGYAETNNILTSTITGIDVEGDPLSFTLATLPSSGTASLTSTGYLTYIPALNFVGSITFTVTSNDGFVDSVPATISVCVISPISTIARPPCAPIISISAPPQNIGPGGGGGGGGASSSMIPLQYTIATSNGTATGLTSQLLLQKNQPTYTGSGTIHATGGTELPRYTLGDMTSTTLMSTIQAIVDTAKLTHISTTNGSTTIRNAGRLIMERILTSTTLSTDEKTGSLDSSITSLTEIKQSATTMRENYTLQYIIRTILLKRASLIKKLTTLVS